ncbi:MAG: hypothetical protein ABI323_10105 [Solirubrobacteraceae bacterium]
MTRTAKVRAAAWNEMFDGYLRRRAMRRAIVVDTRRKNTGLTAR